MNSLEMDCVQNMLAELRVRVDKQDVTIKLMAELQMNVAQNLMSHHIAVKALLSALEKSSPEVMKQVRQNVDAQLATSSSAETQSVLKKVIAMLPPHR